MTLAFFDLDKTLLARNSAALWIRYEYEQGQISRLQALRAAMWLARYKLGSSKIEPVIRESILTLRGKGEDDLLRRSRYFWETRIRRTIRPGGEAALERHRSAGHRLVLLSSTTTYLAQPAVRDLGLDDCLCTRLEVTGQGTFTGRPLEPMCFGRGKVTLAREHAERLGARLDESTFYTDSASDIPMLEMVGTAVAVNPDPRLRRYARKRGWAVVDWGVPRLR